MITDTVQVVILAAGIGKRMSSNKPKVLVCFNGKPLIFHLLEAVKQSGICAKPVIVVGQKAEQVQAALGPDYTYVLQPEQLGTGHAVACSQTVLEGKVENVMVLYGDMPLITAETIKNIAQVHLEKQVKLTMATVTVPDFNDYRECLYHYGHVVRDEAGEFVRSVELKDADPDQRAIKEVNPSYYCFQASWLWSHLKQLENNNAQGEYYLTDLPGLACSQGHKIATVSIDPFEALGVNTPEQLEALEQLIRNGGKQHAGI